MAKNIQINLTFKSDTAAAKKDIDNLQNSLTKIATTPLSVGKTTQMQQNLKTAQKDAIELKVALERATNVDTGKLNFGKLQQELKANGKTLQDYTTNLKNIGPTGTQALTQLGTALKNAETPMLTLSEKAKKMFSTLGNTIRWSISSSLIEGFTNTLQSTIQYAKELNESLTDIRIVTGKSEAEMAKFADRANKAAKSLSATTTEYTKASLIYYQQGLTDKEVLERAETTLKLANVVGESAETVSNWMTSIWNNFDDGSKSLEHYGDVLAALGAKTASSADEIATGLEKFSAIADTVGLSYEYAASALATVTAETRQSADVVGTAFKTIFSRMESLELGETLDDGTTLGKYSAAMAKVGVEIKDANGQMRDMDSILSDLGKQWQFLNKDQQIALAQSVAGIRQYNQFIGLMDNWNVMEDNLETTEKATDMLAYQQEIYASGMEGASKRVEAAFEKVKNTLLDENDLVPLMNAGEKILIFVNDLVEAFGGLPGILTLASSILLKMFSSQTAGFLRGMTSNIAQTVNAISGKTDRDLAAAQKDTYEKGHESAEKHGGEENFHRAQFFREDIELAEQLKGKEHELTEAQREQLNLYRQIIEAKREAILATDRELDKANEIADSRENYLTHAADFDVEAFENEVGPLSDDEESINRTQAVQQQVGEGQGQVIECKCNHAEQGVPLENEPVQGDNKEPIPVAVEESPKVDQPEEAKKEPAETVEENPKTDQLEEVKQEPPEPPPPPPPTEAELAEGRLIEKGLSGAEVEELKRGAEYQTNVDIYGKLLDGSGGKGSNYVHMGSQNHLQMTDDLYNQAKDAGVDSNVLAGMKQSRDTIFEQSDKLQGLKTQKKDLDEKINKGKQEGMDPKELKKLTKERTELNKKIKETKKVIKDSAKAFKDEAKQAKVNENTVKKLTKAHKAQRKEIKDAAKAFEKSAEAQEENRENMEEYNDAMENQKEVVEDAVNGQRDWAATVVDIGQNVATAASGVMMMIGAVDSLSDAIANDEATFSDWLSTIISVVFGMGQLIAPITNIIGLLKKKKTATAAGNAEDLKTIGTNAAEATSEKELGQVKDQEGKKDDARVGKKRTNAIAKATSNIGEQASGGLPGWISAAISAAAVMTILGVSIAVSIPKKQNIQDEEDYSKGLDLGKTVKEDFEKQNELMFEYTDIYETYKKTGEGKEALIEKTNELAEAYNNEAIAIKALAGDYEAANELILEETSKALDQQISQFEESEDLMAGSLETKMEDHDGGFATQSYAAHWIAGANLLLSGATPLGMAISGAIMFNDYMANKDDEINAIAAEEKLNNEGELQYYDISSHATTNDPSDAEGFVGAYEDVSALVNQAKKNGDVSNSELYNGWIDYLSEHKDTYDELAPQVKAKHSAQAQKKVIDARSSKGNSINNVKDMNEYLEIREELLSGATSEEEKELIEASLTEYGGAFEQRALKIEQFEEFFGKDSEYADQLASAIKGANDATMQAINMIDEDMQFLIKEGKLGVEEALKHNMIKIAQAAREDTFQTLYDSAEAGELYTRILEGMNTALNGNAVALNYAAEAAAKLNHELDGAFDVWSKHAGVLVSGQKDTIAYATAVAELSDSLETMFGLDTEIDLTTFTSNNMDLISRFFTGDVEAFNELQTEIAVENAFREGASFEAQDTIRKLGEKNYERGFEITGDTNDGKKILNELNTNFDGLAEGKQQDILKAAGFYADVVNGKITKLTKLTDKDSIDGTIFEEILKELEELIDPLTDVNELLEDMESLLDNISKAKDRAFGRTKLKWSQEETAQLERQLELEKEKLEITKGTYEGKRDKLLQKYDVKLDDSGRIIDQVGFEERMRDLYGDSKEFETIQKDLEDYNKSLNDYQKQNDVVIEVGYELEDKKVADLIDPIKLEIEFNEKEIDRLDWMLSHLEDVNYSSAEKINLLTQQAQLQLETLQYASEGVGDTLKNLFTDEEIARILAGDIDLLNSKEMTEEQAEQMREFVETAQDSADALIEIKAAIEEAMLADFEKYNEEIEYSMGLMDSAMSVLQNYRNIVDLVGKDTLGISNSLLKDMADTTVQNANAKLAASRSAFEANKAAYESAKQAFEEGSITEEAFKAIEEQYNSSMETLMTTWEEALTAASEAFQSNVSIILEEFNDAIGGIYGSIAEMSDWYGKEREKSDFYLKNYEKVYEISKLNRKINQSIDASDSLYAQQKLKGLQDEVLEYQKENKEMSDYDLGYLQKKYDLLQAEIALRDAQNAKNTVRLSRDSEGNYGYVYTADQNAIDAAQQKYEDAIYNMEKYLDDSTDALTQKYLQYSQQWADEIASLDTTAADYEEKAAAITEYYSDLCGMTIEEMSDMVKYGKDINEEYGTHAAETFKETIIGKMYNDVETFDQLSDKVNTEMQNSLTLISQEWTKYQQNISLAMENAGTSVEGFKNNMETYMGNCVTYVNNLENKVGGLASNLETNFNTALGKVKNFAEEFKTNIQPAIDSITSLAKKVNSLLEQYNANRDTFNEIGGYGGEGKGDNGADGGDGGGTVADIVGTKTDAKIGTDKNGNVTFNNKKASKASAAAGYVLQNGNQYVKVKEGADIDWSKDDNGNYTIRTTGRDAKTGKDTTITTTINSADFEKLTGKSITEDANQYQYVVQEPNALAKGAGFVKVKKGDSTWYTHYTNLTSTDGKITSSDIAKNSNVSVKDTSKLKTYLVYDPNATGDAANKVIGGFNSGGFFNSRANDISPKFLSWDEAWEFGEDNMRSAIKERCAYVITHDAKYYGYETNGSKCFSPLEGIKNEKGGDWFSHNPQVSKDSPYLKAKDYETRAQMLDTGGYTGSWGPEGRWALLHQKEIVLNAHDTENFLSAIGIVRDISDQIEKNALAMQYRAALGQVRAAYDSTGTLQQEVTIHAEFPNATNHSEIEEAFKNLTNLASQYANRKF